ncbi:MAG: cupin domain-containing protein [Chloroflexota bacterium]
MSRIDVSGRILDNPQTKEKITFLKTAEDTNGEYVRMQIVLPPGGHVPMNVHQAYSEGYEVVNGRLDVAIGEKDNHKVIGAGNKILAEKGIAHHYWNDSQDPVEFIVEVRPARQFEKFMRIIVGLGKEGKLNKDGAPKNIFQLAMIVRLSEAYLHGLPLGLQKFLFDTIIYRLARLFGYSEDFPEYVM